MIRKGKWKYIHDCEAPNQLFNIDVDRDELVNRAESETDVAADLERELRQICDPDVENERADAFINRELAAIEGADLEMLPGGHAAFRE